MCDQGCNGSGEKHSLHLSGKRPFKKFDLNFKKCQWKQQTEREERNKCLDLQLFDAKGKSETNIFSQKVVNDGDDLP